MSETAIVTVTMREAAPAVRVRPARCGVTATASGGERSLRVALRGRGEAAVVFRDMEVLDVDVRGGFAVVEPGTPWTVRATVEGWLSVTARVRGGRGAAG